MLSVKGKEEGKGKPWRIDIKINKQLNGKPVILHFFFNLDTKSRIFKWKSDEENCLPTSKTFPIVIAD